MIHTCFSVCRRPVTLLGLLFLTLLLPAQPQVKINPVLLQQKWEAQWITCPDVSLTDFGVFRFRRMFDLTEVPQHFIIHVSADNRYRLFVNGEEVARGPARGDLAHWRFESVDIAGYLKKGKNLLAAVVWNYGEYKPLAQISYRTAFIVQGDGPAEQIVNTGADWKVFHDTAYKPLPALQTSVGPGIRVDGSEYPYGWERRDYRERGWLTPRLLGNGIPRGTFTFWDWALVPRGIPALTYEKQRLKEVERSRGITLPSSFLAGKAPVVIPAHQKVRILLDQTFLTTAYPEIVVSGGRGASVELRYAEAMVDKKGVKGNRNVTEGKEPLALYSDIFLPDGGEERHFQPLWFRTYRYLQLVIETRDEPLVLKDLYGYFTAYPFREKARFSSDDSSLVPLWETGWRTARLCAGETYFDCPYYEQLQYVGDTRIQALISLYVAGDDRLMRKAIRQFRNSLQPMGLTLSRYPSCQPQVIPPFSLLWVGMVHDYWMHRDDEAFVKENLNGIRNVLYWFRQHLDDLGMLGPLEWWNFVDWSFGPWNAQKPVGGTPPGALEGNSSILTLQYVRALQQAAGLFAAYGYTTEAEEYRHQAESLRDSIFRHCWDPARGLLADTPQRHSFSQHANILGLLTGMFDAQRSATVLEKILQDKEIVQTTFYFRFYLVEAMVKTGKADTYLDQLTPWKEMLKTGLTTFAETPEPTRSDCHAWSASPLYHFLSVVAGIRPASPGFKTVSIEPHPGDLRRIEASMPHYAGDIVVELKRKGKGVTGTVLLPEGITGDFLWQGKKVPLKEGANNIDL